MTTVNPETGLKESHKSTILDVITANSNVEALWLFGSRARGDFKPNSDIDLVIAGKNLSFSDIAILLDKLELTSIPYKIDLLDKNKITNTELLKRIEQEAIRWF